MPRIVMSVFVVLAAWGMGGCGLMRQWQYTMDAGRALDIHPADGQEVEPRRIHQGPGESTTSNMMIGGSSRSNWEYYSKAYGREGWVVCGDSERPEYDNGAVRGTLKMQRGFEHVWIEMTDVAGGRVQVQQHFYVEQPFDFWSRMLQAGWDALFKGLPADNPVRMAKWIF